MGIPAHKLILLSAVPVSCGSGPGGTSDLELLEQLFCRMCWRFYIHPTVVFAFLVPVNRACLPLPCNSFLFILFVRAPTPPFPFCFQVFICFLSRLSPPHLILFLAQAFPMLLSLSATAPLSQLWARPTKAVALSCQFAAHGAAPLCAIDSTLQYEFGPPGTHSNFSPLCLSINSTALMMSSLAQLLPHSFQSVTPRHYLPFTELSCDLLT